MKHSIAEIYTKAEAHFKKQLPFVVYKKSNCNTLQLWLQKNNELITLNTNTQSSGFVFAPFFEDVSQVIFPIENSEIYKAEIVKNDQHKVLTAKIKSVQNNKQQHLNLVEKAITEIKQGKATKIVVSRKEIVTLNQGEVFEIYKALINTYTNAFVYCWFHPKIGLWLGATPETLLQIKNNTLKTMALAGTQKYAGTVDVKWQEKEIEEQAIVTNYITNKLKPVVTQLKVAKPKTVQAGNVVHLQTIIKANIVKNSTLKLISLLHPTPAVCGLPLNNAKGFIKKNEGYNRAYYTGYLGELNIENQSHIYVNLRCMQVENNRLIIYVGGGITSSSIAENEWIETVTKAETLKQIMTKG